MATVGSAAWWPVVSSADIFDPEALLGSMEQHTQIVTVDAQPATNLVLVALLEVQPMQQLLFLVRKSCQDLPHMGALFGGHHMRFRVDCGVGDLGRRVVVERG